MAAIAILSVILTILVPAVKSSGTTELILINGVPSEHFIIMFHGEEGVLEPAPGGKYIAVAVESSVAVVDSFTDSVVGSINLSGVGWGRTASLAWARGMLVAVNSSCSIAVMGLDEDWLNVDKLISFGGGLKAFGAGSYGDLVLALCGSPSGPALLVLNISGGGSRLIALDGLVSAGNPVFGRGPLVDEAEDRVYFSGITLSGGTYVHGIYYLSFEELSGEEVVPHLLYGIEAPSDWYLVGVRDVAGGMVLASVNNTLLLIDGDGRVRASLDLPWFYGDAVFYGSTDLVTLTFREAYDVEWVAIYDIRGSLVKGLFMRGSVLRLAVVPGKVYTLEPCVPGRDDYLGLYSLAYRGLHEVLSAEVSAVVTDRSARINIAGDVAPGELHSWVSAYFDPARGWWEAVYTTHIHYNGSLYNTVVEIGEGSAGRAYVIEDLALGASPVPGVGVVMAGALVRPPAYSAMRQWYIIDESSGRAVTVLEVGADEVLGVQALSRREWVSYGEEGISLYTLTDLSVNLRVLGEGVQVASPVQGSEYAVIVRGRSLEIVRVEEGGLVIAHSLGVKSVLAAAYNPLDNVLLLVKLSGTSRIEVSVIRPGTVWEEGIMWEPFMTPVAPIDGGVLGVGTGNTSATIVLSSVMGRVQTLAEALSCTNPTIIDYFISPKGVGTAIGCSSNAIVIWVSDSVPRPPFYIIWAAVMSVAYLTVFSLIRLAGQRHGNRQLRRKQSSQQLCSQ